MDFLEIVEQAREVLRSKGRVAYRTLKRQFALDDEALADLKNELIEAERVAVDEDGNVLVWVGNIEEEKGQRITDKGGNGEWENEGETAKRRKGNTEGDKGKRIKEGTENQEPSRWTPVHLAERIRAASVTDGERKTITALFADLKGSTALIEGLDPEEARAIIDPALQVMMDAVHRYEGYVAQVLGDGIFALFGAPIAHEDHPQRAVYAALRMQEAMRRYADILRQKGYPPLLMRVGLNTGEVVVRSIRKDDLHTDYVPVGHSTNLAARMEQLAAPGSILVTEYAYKLTDGYFEFRDLGKTRIKGVEEPLNVYEVLGVGPLRTRLQMSVRRGLTRFVGRQTEMEQLHKALDQAKAGHGQIVAVMGEPGLGKSRLFYEFKLLSQAGHLVLEAYSVSHGKASPYLPVIELLKSYFRIESQDDERQRRAKVTGQVLVLDRTLEDTLPYLFALLGIEEQPSTLQQMDPQIRRRRTFEALKKLFLRESLNQPLILIFEDLHWIDSETQGFLDVLSESIASAKVLLLVNYRPEYRREWSRKTYYTQLRLAPFGKAEAEEFLDALLGKSPLPIGERARVRGMENNLPPLKQLILTKTQGTPFFMEEIVQELIEQGVLRDSIGAGLALPTEGAASSAPTAIYIPPTVQGILASRIDRLAPDEKALLQQLAVIGREFPVSLIHQVLSLPEEELYRLLASLQRKEFLYEQPAFPEVEYIFKHALTQEVAYGTVLQERRKALHERTAQAIEALFHYRLEDHYSELAHHYSCSGNIPKAIEYLQQAGQQAARRCAYPEAVRHFTTALELLQTEPETPERMQQELTLQLALALPLTATKGLAASEVDAVYSRARALSQQVGEPSRLFQVLWRERSFYVMRAELQTARDLAEQLLPLAQRVQDATLLPAAHFGLGTVLFSLGEIISARTHFEHALSLSDPEQRHVTIARVGIELEVTSLRTLASILWLLGYPDQARQRSREALTLVQEIDHPFSTAAVWFWDTVLQQFLHEEQVVAQRAETGIGLSLGFAVWEAWGIIMRGWALAEQGQPEEGIQQIHQGMADTRVTGAEWLQPYRLALLAEAYGQAGKLEKGKTALTEALDTVNKTGERWWEAELYRLKGELLLAQGSKNQKAKIKRQKSEISNTQHLAPNTQEEAGACFFKAIEIARKQQAKSLELRATMSLARLWQTQSKHTEAHRVLSEIYNWFTEGFDTKDLQEASALLQNLEGRQ